MKVGLVARAEDRGLGHMTWGFHQALAPERTLVVDMGDLARGFVPHLDRYPDAVVVPFQDSQLAAEQLVRDWLTGLDVVYSAETFYDPRLVQWAREAGTATVLHAMPEFYRADLPTPTRTWVPTGWRLGSMPAGTEVVPVPMDAPANRPPDMPPAMPAELRVVHVAGHRAMADRNGTGVLLTALRYVREPMRVRLETQDARLPSTNLARHVQLERRVGGRADRWALYADADVLVLPRRYGGLCLPALEAMVCGLAVVMPNVEPNQEWPTVRVPADLRGSIETAAGIIPLANTDPQLLAVALDRLASTPHVLHGAQLSALAWAQRNTWARLGNLYLDKLAEAAGL